MGAVDFKEIEDRLGVSLPDAYRRALADHQNLPCPDDDVYFLKNTREILIQNLELRMAPRDDGFAGARWPASFICIGPDGCGNYYAISADDPACAVQFFDHEADEFQPISESLPGFFQYVADILEEAASIRPSLPAEGYNVTPPRPSGDAVLARADVPRESVLNPISLEEWTRFVESNPDMEMRGYRTIVNPLRQTEIREPFPGLAVLAGEVSNREFMFAYGRVIVRRPGEPALEKLHQAAKVLNARVLTEW